MLDGTAGDHLSQSLAQSWANLDHIAQGCVWLAFEYLQGWRLHSLSGHLVQCLFILAVIFFLMS